MNQQQKRYAEKRVDELSRTATTNLQCAPFPRQKELDDLREEHREVRRDTTGLRPASVSTLRKVVEETIKGNESDSLRDDFRCPDIRVRRLVVTDREPEVRALEKRIKAIEKEYSRHEKDICRRVGAIKAKATATKDEIQLGADGQAALDQFVKELGTL